MIDYSQNQRRRFSEELFKLMLENEKIVVVTGDLGYGVLDKIKDRFPKRFINVGAAEQVLMGLSVGLALEGKIPIAYSISSFLLYRPFETIRNYIHAEKIPVKLVGSGRDMDYGHDGLSHWSNDDRDIMKVFSNIKTSWPKTADDVSKILPKIITDDNPWYLNLKR